MRGSVLILVLAACRSGTLSGAEANWSVSPPSLMLPTARTGQTSVAAIVVSNSGEAPVALTLQVDAPFSVVATVTLGGGDTRSLNVTFAPTHAGAFAGTLHVTGGDGKSSDVAVSARAEEPLCAHDGDPCASDCLQQATCSGGACVGTPRDCSDGNTCTIDTCAEGVGCTHAQLACPVPSDPCRMVAACDPLNGCVGVAKPDGTKCGDSDCVTSRVCISGACATRPTPNGATCGKPSACRPAGACQANVCVFPPQQVMVPEWATTTTARIEFAGNIDARGNVYYLECGATSCQLVSLTPDGIERFRTTTEPFVSLYTFSDFVIAGSLVILASPESDLVAAFDTTFGNVVWERHTNDELPPCVPAKDSNACMTFAPLPGAVWPLASDGQGHLMVSSGWVLNVDALTGVTRWRVVSQDVWDVGSAYDEVGNLYLASTMTNPDVNSTSPMTVLSVSPQGQQRWAAPHASSTGLTPLGAFQGTLAVNDSGGLLRLLDAATGSERGASMPGQLSWGAVMGGKPSRIFTFMQASPASGLSLLAGDLSTGLFSTRPVTDGLGDSVLEATSPLLTSQQTLLTAVFANGTWRLDELNLDGGVASDCELPLAVNYRQSTASPGHWVALKTNTSNGSVQIVSFAVPELELADAGWVSERGTPTQGNCPR